jgi:hypothetical protein
MINFIFEILKINSVIKKKKINNLFFVDSFGGILEFFNLFELHIKNKHEKYLIVVNSIGTYNFLKKIPIFKNNIIYYNSNDLLLRSYLKKFYLIIFKIFFHKVSRVFLYKLVTDPLRFVLINLITNKDSEIIISDQFYKYYKFNHNFKKNNIKYFFAKIINYFSTVKIIFYKHQDLEERYYPCLDKKYLINCKNYKWDFFIKKFFRKKINIKKNSLLLIDDTIDLLIKDKWIQKRNLINLLEKKIFNFIKKNKIQYIYTKEHPTSEIESLFLKKFKYFKINKISKQIPLEFIIDQFKYCIFSVTSSIYYSNKAKLYNFSKILNFKKSIYKKKYYKLLKKNSGKNYYKLQYI